MTPGNRTLIDYGSALAVVALAWLVRWLIDPALGNQAAYATFVIAVIFVAWRSGLRPAVGVMMLGFLIGYFFFLGPRYEITTKSRPDLIGSGMYLVICLAISVFSE